MQGLSIKIFKPKEFRPKKLKMVNKKTSILSHNNKPIKPNCQNKKKKLKKKQD